LANGVRIRKIMKNTINGNENPYILVNTPAIKGPIIYPKLILISSLFLIASSCPKYEIVAIENDEFKILEIANPSSNLLNKQITKKKFLPLAIKSDIA
jgi:hypothetical protein